MGELLNPNLIKHPDKEEFDYSNTEKIDEYLKEQFPGIEPSEKEIFNGKLESYKLAYYRQEKERKERESEERKINFSKMWSFSEMERRAISYGTSIGIAEDFDFVIDEHNEEVFKLLCLYFTNDPEFEKHSNGDQEYSLNKGIWLQSSVRGSGKTVLLKCFTFNKRCCFGYRHTNELKAAYQRKGFDGIDLLIGTIPVSASGLNFYQQEAGFMYDEMFGDSQVNYMGTPIVISEYIVNTLYDFSDNNKKEKWKFHCTSNAAGQDIENNNGINYRSRMADMYNFIKLEGPDRRRKKK